MTGTHKKRLKMFGFCLTNLGKVRGRVQDNTERCSSVKLEPNMATIVLWYVVRGRWQSASLGIHANPIFDYGVVHVVVAT